MKSRQLKLVAASIGAGGLIATGVLTVVSGDPPGTMGDGPELTLGETTTSTTPPSAPETSIATPTVTATTSPAP